VKPFKYKLQSVLKLREFEKKKIENQLSSVNFEIQKTKKKIEDILLSISDLQNKINKVGENGFLDLSLIKYFPEFLIASEKEVENLKNYLNDQEKLREETLKSLDECMAKVKILEKDKEIKIDKYKFDQRKKENLELEDMQIILRGRR